MEAAVQVHDQSPTSLTRWQRERHPAPKPKNGRYLVALIAGGPKDRARELKEALAQRVGVFVKYHIEYCHAQGKGSARWKKPLPKDVDLVLILKTMIGHGESNAARDAARRAGVVCIATQHKWSTMAQILAFYNIQAKTSTPLPLTVSGEPLVEVEEEEPASDETLAAKLPALVPHLRDLVPATLVVEPAPEPPPVVAPPIQAAPIPAYGTPGTASAETIGLILELQRRVRLEGLDTILVSSMEITMNSPKRH